MKMLCQCKTPSVFETQFAIFLKIECHRLSEGVLMGEGFFFEHPELGQKNDLWRMSSRMKMLCQCETPSVFETQFAIFLEIECHRLSVWIKMANSGCCDSDTATCC